MALSYEFLIARAEQAAEQAASAQLDNVRERALRSEKAWRVMANEVLEVARQRELALEAKALSQNSV
jgi:hypothetical protein